MEFRCDQFSSRTGHTPGVGNRAADRYHAGVQSSTGHAAYVQRRAHKTVQLARRSRHAPRQTQRN